DGVARFTEDGYAHLPAEHAQLLDGGRALQVGPDEQRMTTLLLEPAGELAGSGGLTGALQAGEQDNRRRLRRVGDAQRLAPEDADQLLVDDLDDLLSGREALRQVEPERPLLYPLGELPGDPDVDVGLEQGDADLAQDLVDVLFAQAAAAAQAGEDGVETVW